MAKSQEVSKNFLSRPEPIIALGSFCFAVMMISYFIRIPGVIDLSRAFGTWITSLEWWAILVALITQVQRNVKNITTRRKDWHLLDLSSLIILFTMVLAYFWPGGGGNRNQLYVIYNVSVRGVASTAVFGMHGFLVASAMFRVLKASSIQRLVGIVLLFLMMLYQIPLGDWMWPGIAGVGDWLSNVILTAGNRAIVICSAIGMFILGIRVLLGKEPQQYGLEVGKKANVQGGKK